MGYCKKISKYKILSSKQIQITEIQNSKGEQEDGVLSIGILILFRI